MKHSEFKKRVEELGFEVIDISKHHGVANEDGVFAWVSKNYESVLDNDYENFHKISPENKQIIFDILVDYARTPIEDRKDEKRYSIHPIRTLDYKLIRYDSIFHYCGYEDEDSFDIAFPAPYEKGVSITFTESEAREICDYFGWDFSKVAVEVEDDE